MTYQKIAVKPISGFLGAEISGVDLALDLDNQTWDEIYRAFLDHGLIVFHGQDLTPEQNKAFAARFGPLVKYPFAKGLDDHPEIFEIRKEPDEARNFGGNWHTDMSFTGTPPLGTMLYCKQAPSRGGDTALTNLSMAYETLSDGMKRMLDGVRGRYSAAIKDSGGRVARMKDTRFRPDELDRAEEEHFHPIVRTHPETGRKALYISGGHLVGIQDMADEESKPLLDYLKAHATRQDFVARARYETGTLALWDNRCTQHMALNDYPGETRVMHRLTIGSSDVPH